MVIQWDLRFKNTRGTVKTVQYSEVVLLPRSISMHWIGLGTRIHVGVRNSQVVHISQVVLKQISLYIIAHHPRVFGRSYVPTCMPYLTV